MKTAGKTRVKKNRQRGDNSLVVNLRMEATLPFLRSSPDGSSEPADPAGVPRKLHPGESGRRKNEDESLLRPSGSGMEGRRRFPPEPSHLKEYRPAERETLEAAGSPGLEDPTTAVNYAN
jgi:hypothetical protein